MNLSLDSSDFKGIKLEMRRLLSKTARNIRQIQTISDEFSYPVLKEWHYATIHIFNLFFEPDRVNEYGKALQSLKNAYADSCLILLSIYLDNARYIIKRYGCSSRSKTTCKFLREYGDVARSGKLVIMKMEDAALSASLDMDTVERILSEFKKYEVQYYECRPVLNYERRKSIFHFIRMLVTVVVSALIMLLSYVMI